MNYGFVPCGEYSEGSGFGAAVTAGHRGVDGGAVFGGGGGGYLGGEGGFGGGHVDDDSTGTKAREGAGRGVEEDVADVGRVADYGENDVGLGSERMGGVGEVGTDVEERLGLGEGAVEDGDGVAGVE